MNRMTSAESGNVEVVLSLDQVNWRDGMGQVHVGHAVAYTNTPVYLDESEDGTRRLVSASAIHHELWPNEVPS